MGILFSTQLSGKNLTISQLKKRSWNELEKRLNQGDKRLSQDELLAFFKRISIYKQPEKSETSNVAQPIVDKKAEANKALDDSNYKDLSTAVVQSATHSSKQIALISLIHSAIAEPRVSTAIDFDEEPDGISEILTIALEERACELARKGEIGVIRTNNRPLNSNGKRCEKNSTAVIDFNGTPLTLIAEQSPEVPQESIIKVYNKYGIALGQVPGSFLGQICFTKDSNHLYVLDSSPSVQALRLSDMELVRSVNLNSDVDLMLNQEELDPANFFHYGGKIYIYLPRKGKLKKINIDNIDTGSKTIETLTAPKLQREKQGKKRDNDKAKILRADNENVEVISTSGHSGPKKPYNLVRKIGNSWVTYTLFNSFLNHTTHATRDLHSVPITSNPKTGEYAWLKTVDEIAISKRLPVNNGARSLEQYAKPFFQTLPTCSMVLAGNYPSVTDIEFDPDTGDLFVNLIDNADQNGENDHIIRMSPKAQRELIDLYAENEREKKASKEKNLDPTDKCDTIAAGGSGQGLEDWQKSLWVSPEDNNEGKVEPKKPNLLWSGNESESGLDFLKGNEDDDEGFGYETYKGNKWRD